MPVSLTPDYLFDRYDQIAPGWLARQGVTLLLSDLDFTLAPKSVRRPDEKLRTWIAALKAEGIAFMIVSNNRSGRRVTEFCAELGVPYQGHARKPSPKGLEAAMRKAGFAFSDEAVSYNDDTRQTLVAWTWVCWEDDG